MMLFVGLLPSKTFDLSKAAFEASAPRSFLTSSSFLPKASASGSDTRQTIQHRIPDVAKTLTSEEVAEQYAMMLAI